MFSVSVELWLTRLQKARSFSCMFVSVGRGVGSAWQCQFKKEPAIGGEVNETTSPPL